MAICRCIQHQPRNNRIHIYNYLVEPLGYITTSSICGRCRNSGFIWLTEAEYAEFLNGERIFKFATNVTKVKVSNKITKKTS